MGVSWGSKQKQVRLRQRSVLLKAFPPLVGMEYR